MAVIVERDSTDEGWWHKTPHLNHRYVPVDKWSDKVYPLLYPREGQPDPSIRCVTGFGALNDFGKAHLFDNRFVTYPRCHWARRCVLCNIWYSLEENASPTDWPHVWEEGTSRFFAWRNGREETLSETRILGCRECGAIWDMRVDDDEEPVKKKLL